jgi:glyoxylase-like metal-dependent hydrolase (beta-lactamase superfamily II)
MPSQRVLASGVTWFDLLFQGRPNRIACGVVTGAAGTAIVDPGPTSTIETLEASLAMQGQSLASVTHIVLTHIHLDHAGATGTILRRHPGIRVLVHERGARGGVRDFPKLDRLGLPGAQLRVERGGLVQRLADLGQGGGERAMGLASAALGVGLARTQRGEDQLLVGLT